MVYNSEEIKKKLKYEEEVEGGGRRRGTRANLNDRRQPYILHRFTHLSVVLVAVSCCHGLVVTLHVSRDDQCYP